MGLLAKDSTCGDTLLDFQNGRFRNQKPPGKLREKAYSPEGKCDKIGVSTALFQYLLRDLVLACFSSISTLFNDQRIA